MNWLLLSPDGQVVHQVISDRNPCLPGEDGSSPAYEHPLELVIAVVEHGDLAVQEWDGAKWVDKIDALRTRALIEIDQKRLARLDKPAGLIIVHQRKAAEAAVVLGSDEIDPGSVPLLAAESVRRDMPISALAQFVLDAQEIADQQMREVEAAAMGAKQAVRLAGTGDEIAAILAAFDLDLQITG